MKYFELEEKRLKNLLKTEKLWGKEKKEGEKVRCTKHLGTPSERVKHFKYSITLVTDKTATRYLFKGKSVVYCSESLHVISFWNENVEAAELAEGHSSSRETSST